MLKYTLSCQKGEISSKTTSKLLMGQYDLVEERRGRHMRISPSCPHSVSFFPCQVCLVLSWVFFLNVGVFGVTVKFMAGGSHFPLCVCLVVLGSCLSLVLSPLLPEGQAFPSAMWKFPTAKAGCYSLFLEALIDLSVSVADYIRSDATWSFLSIIFPMLNIFGQSSKLFFFYFAFFLMLLPLLGIALWYLK